MPEGYAVQWQLNRLAKTQGYGEALAANTWAGTSGLETVGALNSLAGFTNPRDYLDMMGVCNLLAGTDGLEVPEALAQIPTPP